MKTGTVCTICGKRPDSFYVHVNSYAAQRGSVFCSLFNVDVHRLFEDLPGGAGIVCLRCLSAYRRRDSVSLGTVGK